MNDSQASRNGITRREFLKTTALGSAGLALSGLPGLAEPSRSQGKSPNLIFIHTDQQHFDTISGLGCKHAHTPNMDRLVQRGITFTQSFSANPVCCPARACWYTGRTASENGMLSNAHTLRSDLPDLGQWFGARGYNAYYAGKWHVPGRNPRESFISLTSDTTGQGEHGDPVVSRAAQAFLRNYSEDKPFFLSLGFLQPHDCCYWAFAHEESIDQIPYPEIEAELPPLPENFEYDIDEPEALREHLAQMRLWTDKWSPLHWRYYMWSYYRQVEMVDAEIGRVVDALENSRFDDNTLIIFMADHGDGLARRKLIQKWFFYDESVRVPLIICAPGVSRDGRKDTRNVVSGLDIPATLCDYAGIDAPPSSRGMSLLPLIEGRTRDWREFIVSEANIAGRMVRTPEYKFVAYKDDPIEQLFDVRRDPWEMHNLAADAHHADRLSDLRKLLRSWESRLEIANS